MLSGKISKNARAVVTGAGSGIGAGFALELARRGGRVVCADINPDAAAKTVAEIEQQGGRAQALPCDVSRLEEVETLREKSEHWFSGAPNLVVNNAGVGVGGQPIGELPMEDWRWAMDVNFWGVVHGCHVFATAMRELPSAGIINVCSAASFAAAPMMGPYNASKAAALAVSETLAAEMAGTQVRVTALCPTWVKTNIAKDGRISEQATQMAGRMMNLTGMQPDRVARMTLNGLDRGQRYVLPQIDARLIWRLKRLAPAGYGRTTGLFNRLMAGDTAWNKK